MTAEARRGGPTRQRLPVGLGIALVMAILLFLFVESARARSADAERHRRAQEIEAREPELYRQLADQAGVRESERQIHIERFRRLETQVRQQGQDIAELGARLSGAASVDAQ